MEPSNNKSECIVGHFWSAELALWDELNYYKTEDLFRPRWYKIGTFLSYAPGRAMCKIAEVIQFLEY